MIKNANYIHAFVFIVMFSMLYGISVAFGYETKYSLGLLKITAPVIIIAITIIIVFNKHKDMVRLLVSGLYYFFALFLNAITSAIAFYRNPSNLETLPDRGFDFVPRITTLKLPFGIIINGQEVPDYIYPIVLIITVTLVLSHKNRWYVLQRCLTIWGSIMFLRAVTVLFTSIPDASVICSQITPGTTLFKDMNPIRVMSRALAVVMPGSVGSITCGDLIFSGHTTELILCGMICNAYLPPSKFSKYLKLIMWGFIIILLYLLIGVRMHYTVDVFLAIYITTTTFNSYHRLAHDVQVKINYTTLSLDKYFFVPIVDWLEGYRNDLSESPTQLLQPLSVFELITILCSKSVDFMKDFISRGDEQIICRWKKEMKLCKEYYLNENYELTKTEEMISDSKQNISKLENEKKELIKKEKQQDNKNKQLLNEFTKHMEKTEELNKKLIKLIQENKTKECLELLNNPKKLK